MNIYFLVEGDTEFIIYRKWLSYLVPELKRVKYHDQVNENNYYISNAHGNALMIHDGIPNAVEKIQEMGNYNYFVICLDADEETVESRKNWIYEFIETEKIELGKTKLEIVIQNRCLETWFLGNRKIFDSRQPLEKLLNEYVLYYDISQDDPELMGKYNQEYHADFHLSYLKEIFKIKRQNYGKTRPQQAQENHYLEQLLKRIQEKPEQMQTFREFIEFCESIKIKSSP